MKQQLNQKLFAFIIAIAMFSLFPEFIVAQNGKRIRCGRFGCPIGYICVNGFCKRNLPFFIDSSSANESVSVFSASSNAQRCGWGLGVCPRNYVCMFGICVKKNRVNGPNIITNEPANYLLSISGINSTTISLELTETQNVSLKIYDATGRVIKKLADNRMPQGEHQIEWGAKDESGNALQAGVYILKMEADYYTEAKKILIIK